MYMLIRKLDAPNGSFLESAAGSIDSGRRPYEE